MAQMLTHGWWKMHARQWAWVSASIVTINVGCARIAPDDSMERALKLNNALGSGHVLVCDIDAVCPECSVDLAVFTEVQVGGQSLSGLSATVTNGEVVAQVPGSPGTGRLLLLGTSQIEVAWVRDKGDTVAHCESVVMTHRAVGIHGQVKGMSPDDQLYIHGCEWKATVDESGEFFLLGQVPEGGSCQLRAVKMIDGDGRVLGPPVDVWAAQSEDVSVVVEAPP